MNAADLITDAMVEAALDATLAHGTLAFPCEDGERTCAECGYAFGWAAGSGAVEAQRYVEHRLRAALEAVAPAIAAKAWEEGYQACRNRPRVDGYLREVIRRRIALRERDGHERLLLNHEALRALLDAADFLDEVRAQVARGALCPMCSTGMTRQTVGMVCQLCGTDYGDPS